MYPAKMEARKQQSDQCTRWHARRSLGGHESPAAQTLAQKDQAIPRQAYSRHMSWVTTRIQCPQKGESVEPYTH